MTSNCFLFIKTNPYLKLNYNCYPLSHILACNLRFTNVFKTFNVFRSYLITVCKEPVKAILTGETFAIETHGVCGKFSGNVEFIKLIVKMILVFQNHCLVEKKHLNSYFKKFYKTTAPPRT